MSVGTYTGRTYGQHAYPVGDRRRYDIEGRIDPPDYIPPAGACAYCECRPCQCNREN